MIKNESLNENTKIGGILGGAEIQRRIHTSEAHEKIYVTPLLDEKKQIGAASFDVRLGTEFIIFKRTKFSLIDLLEAKGSSIERQIGEYQEKIFVAIGSKLVLHPQQLVLGSTLEYIRIPNDLTAEVIGRSSWGREGLVIATAPQVQPCFAGVITLELANEADAPITLYPGSRIAQLVFNTLIDQTGNKKPRLLDSKYTGSTGPSFSMLHEDKDWNIIRKVLKLRTGWRHKKVRKKN